MEDVLSRLINAGAGGAIVGAVLGALVVVIPMLMGGIKKFRLGGVNYRRKIVGATALAAALGMSLFPPWRFEYTGRSLDKGYALLFNPPPPQILTQIDLPQLSVQWAIVGIIALIVILLIKD